MLVESFRHTPGDLELWHDLEQCDLEEIVPEYRVTQAVLSINEFVAVGQCYAGVSWGKDSVVLAHLLWLHARHVPLVHLRPDNTNEDCDIVRDMYFQSFPGQPYAEIPVSYAGIDRRFGRLAAVDRETDSRWYAAIRESEKTFGERRILGIRGDESTGRKIRMFRWGTNSVNASAPIGFWSTGNVFSYLARNDLPVHPVYAMLGGGRWNRERLRVAEIGDVCGSGMGRAEWEREYYGDVLRRIEKQSARK